MSNRSSRVALATLIIPALAGMACESPSDGPVDDVTRTASAINTGFADQNFGDGAGWTGVQYYSTIRYPDINGDARTDVCGRWVDGIHCGIDNGYGQFANDALWSGTFSDAAGWNAAPYYATIAFPDLNHDGKADVCGRSSTGVVCGLSNGSGFGAPTTWSNNYTDAFGWGQPQYYTTIGYPDLNGDGKPDICGRGNNGVWCALSNGTSFGTATLWSSTFSDAAGWNVPQYYATISYPDINGDGKADLCGRGPSGLMCALSSGTSFGGTSLWSGSFSDAAGWASPQYYTTIQFADVDGDGKADACGRGFGGMLCATSSGSAFNVLNVWDGAYSDNNGWTQPQYYSTLHIMNGVLCGRPPTASTARSRITPASRTARSNRPTRATTTAGRHRRRITRR